MSSPPRKLPQARNNTTASANNHGGTFVSGCVCVRWEQEGNFIDLSLTEDNSSPSASLVAITNDLRARTRFIVAQPVTFSAADPERREGLPACVYVCREMGVCVCDVKHMSPRVLRQGSVSRQDKGEEEEGENEWRQNGDRTPMDIN